LNTQPEQYKILGIDTNIDVPATPDDLLEAFGKEKVCDFAIAKNIAHNTMPKIRGVFLPLVATKTGIARRTKGGVELTEGTKVPDGDSLESEQTYFDRVCAQTGTTASDYQAEMDQAAADPKAKFTMETVVRQAAKVAKQYVELAEAAIASPDFPRWAKKFDIDPATATVDQVARKISEVYREKAKNKLALVGLKS
jgi:hypothetical protein